MKKVAKGNVGYSPVGLPYLGQLAQKRDLLFLDMPHILALLSDLSVCVGICSYWKALPNMTRADAKKIITLCAHYRSTISRSSLAQRGVINEINDLLNGIVRRGRYSKEIAPV